MSRGNFTKTLWAISVFCVALLWSTTLFAQDGEDTIKLEYKFERGLKIKQNLAIEMKMKLTPPRINSVAKPADTKKSSKKKGKVAEAEDVPASTIKSATMSTKTGIQTESEIVYYDSEKKEATIKSGVKSISVISSMVAGGQSADMFLELKPDSMKVLVNGKEQPVPEKTKELFNQVFQPITSTMSVLGETKIVEMPKSLPEEISKMSLTSDDIFLVVLPEKPISKRKPEWEIKKEKDMFFGGKKTTGNLHAKFKYLKTENIDGVECAKIQAWNIMFIDDVPGAAMQVPGLTDKFNFCMKSRSIVYLALEKGYIKKVEFKSIEFSGTLGEGQNNEIISIKGSGTLTAEEIKAEE